MPMAHLDDESAQSDAQFTLLTVVLVDHSLLTVNTIKHATRRHMKHSQFSNFGHFPIISWKRPAFMRPEDMARIDLANMYLIYANA